MQEALTNVIKHGGCAPTDVRVHYRADAVEVLVPTAATAAPSTLASPAAARASSACASACACTAASCTPGRARGGGFEVVVRLPLEGEEDAALTAGARA